MSKENPSQIRTAIVDSGIDASHSGVGDVAGRVQIQISEEGEVLFLDDHADCTGHGTACAGIIRKKAPDAALYSVRIFDESLIADGRALIAAIQWCIDNEMDVANLSLGTTDVTFKASLQKVCRKAVDAGVILIAAGSNDGGESYPAVFPEVIGVTGGAIYEVDGFYYCKDQRIECVARGDEQRVCWLNGKHIMTGGNSFASPHITGIVGTPLGTASKMFCSRYSIITTRKSIK